MPKFTFECACETQFTRTLKMGEHKTHECPACGKDATRVWEGFGFAFAPGGKAPANSGVSKHDYPTADYAVGSDADKRWQEHAAREVVKSKVRKKGGTHALIRETGKDYIEYKAGSDGLIKGRKGLAKEVKEIRAKQKGET